MTLSDWQTTQCLLVACFLHPDQDSFAIPFRERVRKAWPNFALPTTSELLSKENEQLQLEVFHENYKELRNRVVCNETRVPPTLLAG